MAIWTYYTISLVTWPITYVKLLGGDTAHARRYFKERFSHATSHDEGEDDENSRFPFKKLTKVGGLFTVRHTAFVLAVVALLLVSNAGLPG